LFDEGRRTHATVTLTLDALAALREDAAQLAGHGTITADLARTLADAAESVTLLVLDSDTGRPVGISDRTYRPRQHLRDKITTLFPTCYFTGCTKPADASDLDHIVPFDHGRPDRGGPTTIDNLVPACRHHHLLKTFAGWTYHDHHDGTITLHSPIGITSATRHAPLPLARHDLQPDDDEPPPL